MARYSDFLGRSVVVQYRAGDIISPASGTFVADSGRSIFLEQHLKQHGQQKYFRWEIPYQYIVRLEETPEALGNPREAPAAPAAVSSGTSASSPAAQTSANSAAHAAAAGGGASTLLPLPSGPKTA